MLCGAEPQDLILTNGGKSIWGGIRIQTETYNQISLSPWAYQLQMKCLDIPLIFVFQAHLSKIGASSILDSLSAALAPFLRKESWINLYFHKSVTPGLGLVNIEYIFHKSVNNTLAWSAGKASSRQCFEGASPPKPGRRHSCKKTTATKKWTATVTRWWQRR